MQICGGPRDMWWSEEEYAHFSHLCENEQRDASDMIEWIAGQPWCNGKVVMLGHSYFGQNLSLVAGQPPRCLKRKEEFPT